MNCIRFEDHVITAEEIALVEDFETIDHALSKRYARPDETPISTPEALTGWGYNIAEQLNTGELTQPAARDKYRITAQLPSLLQFAQVDHYRLSLERSQGRWIPCVCGTAG